MRISKLAEGRRGKLPRVDKGGVQLVEQVDKFRSLGDPACFLPPSLALPMLHQINVSRDIGKAAFIAANFEPADVTQARFRRVRILQDYERTFLPSFHRTML